MRSELTKILLLNAAAATGNGVAFACAFSGRYCFAVAGTFGGTSVALQLLGPDGVTWLNVEDSSGALAITAARALIVDLPAGSYRAVVTGGAGMSIYATLSRVVD